MTACSSCGEELDSRNNEILLHVAVAVILASKPRQALDIEKRIHHICEECGIAGRVPLLDAGLLKEILKASKEKH